MSEDCNMAMNGQNVSAGIDYIVQYGLNVAFKGNIIIAALDREGRQHTIVVGDCCELNAVWLFAAMLTARGIQAMHIHACKKCHTQALCCSTQCRC